MKISKKDFIRSAMPLIKELLEKELPDEEEECEMIRLAQLQIDNKITHILFRVSEN